jgi:hypothetical protein
MNVAQAITSVEHETASARKRMLRGVVRKGQETEFVGDVCDYVNNL